MRHRAGPGPETQPNQESDGAFETDALDSVAGARSARVRIGVGAGVVILIVALVGAVVVNAVAQGGSGAEVVREPAPAGSEAPAADLSSTASASVPVLVHVLGAVNRPGLVALTTGARVVDAVAAAGGLTDDAELSGVNLARLVADGEQLVVPRVGEVLPPPAGNAGGGGSAGATGVSGGLVNLNTADQAALETLPRIGPALAGRILDYRSANGRFAAVADLLKVTGIGQKLFDGLKDRITV
ncbi:ComEA family DNA-binding protein [Leifsonia sp. NPDC058230]|uniref:ComEA family DNA-binding protein n=1 Tax=Leifsonia sp. NPDC058230 TaxID=3346391 RepID=UPI0036D78624